MRHRTLLLACEACEPVAKAYPERGRPARHPEGTRRARCPRSGGWSFVLATLLIASFPIGVLHAAEQTPGSDYAGIVTNPDGSPAVGCKVWLASCGSNLSPFQVAVVEESVTDVDGHFALRTPRPEPYVLGGRSFTLFARDDKGRLGWLTLPPALRLVGSSHGRTTRDVEIKLREVQEYHGCLLQTSGEPIAKATIEPIRFDNAVFRQGSSTETLIPPAVAKEMAGETAGDGSFVLHGLPLQGTVDAKITVPGFGAPTVHWGLGKPVTIELDQPGKVSGSVVCPENQAVVRDLRLRLVYRSGNSAAEDVKFSTFSFISALTQADGTFCFHDVVPGEHWLRVQENEGDEGFPYYAELPPLVEVKPGQTVSDITVPLRPTFPVKGKVIDQQIGDGIKGIGLSFSIDLSTGHTRPLIWPFVRTDERGEFTARLPAGKSTIFVAGCPERYIATAAPILRFEVNKSTNLPPIELQQAANMEGIVVDESGAPVAGAEVLRFDEAGFSPAARKVITNESGRFYPRGVVPKKRFLIRARTNSTVTDGPVFVDPEKAPVRLVVSPKHAFSVSGMLVDEEGRPVADAAVSLGTHWQIERTSFRLTGAKSDAQGRFEFRGLWSGDSYTVNVHSEGYEGVGTDRVRGEPGKHHDFGKLTVISIRLHFLRKRL